MESLPVRELRANNHLALSESRENVTTVLGLLLYLGPCLGAGILVRNT